MRQAKPEKIEKVRQNLEDIKSFLKDGDTILDVGCGVGVFYKHLGEPPGYFGIDIDAGEISKAKEAWPEADFRVMDLYDLKGRWDVVICSRVLVHLPDFEGAMKVLLGCAKRLCIILVGIEHDRVGQEESGVYFRQFSEDTIRAIGDCTIIPRVTYATVAYGA